MTHALLYVLMVPFAAGLYLGLNGEPLGWLVAAAAAGATALASQGKS